MSSSPQPDAGSAVPRPPRTATQHLLGMKFPMPLGVLSYEGYVQKGQAALASASQEDWALAHRKAGAEQGLVASRLGGLGRWVGSLLSVGRSVWNDRKQKGLMRTRICTCLHACAQRGTQAHARMHARAHTRTRTHTHTRTHAHKQVF